MIRDGKDAEDRQKDVKGRTLGIWACERGLRGWDRWKSYGAGDADILGGLTVLEFSYEMCLGCQVHVS